MIPFITGGPREVRLRVEWWLPGAGGRGEWEVVERGGGDSCTEV